MILHASRFAANYLSFAFFPSVRKKSYNGSLTILSWGGVRGGISLALILAVANIPQLAEYSSILIGYTFIAVLLSGVVCGLGLPAVMNAFYYNPHQETTGFKGWYQRMCHKMNRKGFQYRVSEDAQGREGSESRIQAARHTERRKGGQSFSRMGETAYGQNAPDQSSVCFAENRTLRRRKIRKQNLRQKDCALVIQNHFSASDNK